MTATRHVFWLGGLAGIALMWISFLDVDRFNVGRSLSSRGYDSSQNSFYQQAARHHAIAVAGEESQPVHLKSDHEGFWDTNYEIVPAFTSAIVTSSDEEKVDPSADANIIAHVTAHGPSNSNRMDLADVSRKVVFVHVGKAGGNTVRAAYPRLWCRKGRRPTEDQLARCFRKHWRDDSPLSQQCDLELHMGSPSPRKQLQEYTTFLFAIRNPMTRAISSYSYLHHNNTKSAFAQKKHYLKNNFYKICFPTLQHLLKTLHNATQHIEPQSRSTSVDRTKVEQILTKSTPYAHPQYCKHMAIAVLEGKSPLVSDINIHLRDNYQFYYRKTIQAFPNMEVLAVRTEKIWDDMKDLDRATGGSGDFPMAGAVANENTKTKQARQDPTPEQLRDLCCILWEDIGIYQEIVNLALNLNYSTKVQTLEDVWSTCGIDSNERGQYQLEGAEKHGQAVQFSWNKWHQEKCPSFS